MNGLKNLFGGVIDMDLLGWMLIHSTWQIGLIGFLFLIGRSLIGRMNPSERSKWMYGFGCLCILLVLTLPPTWLAVTHINNDTNSNSISPLPVWPENGELTGVSSNIMGPSLDKGSLHGNEIPADSPIARPSLPAQSFGWLVPFWMVGVALFLLRPLIGSWNVRTLRNRHLSNAPERIIKLGQRLQEQLGVANVVKINTSPLVEIPSVVGFFKPLILLPSSMMLQLNIQQTEQILAHELAHIKRNDYLINFLQTIVEAVFFYHPVVWWLSHELRQERENCCDDIAIAATGNKRQYAEALAQLESLKTGLPLNAQIVSASGGSLVKRIRRIAGAPQRQHSLWPTALSFSTLLAGPLFMLCFTNSPHTIPQHEQIPETASLTPKPDSKEPLIGKSEFTPSTAINTQQNDAPGTSRTIDNLDVAAVQERIRSIAESNGVHVTKQMIKDRIAVLAARFGMTESRYRKILTSKREELDLDQSVRYELLLEGIVKDQVSVSDDEIAKAYESAYGWRANVLAIVCDSQRNAIRIWQLANANKAESKFAELASQWSDNAASKANRGAIPPIRKWSGNQLLEDAAFRLKKGEISGVIEVGAKYVILYSKGLIKPPNPPSLESVRKDLALEIRERRTRIAIVEFLDLIKELDTSNQTARTGQIEDPAKTKNRAIVKTYHVSDLVVPIPRQVGERSFNGKEWTMPLAIPSPAQKAENMIDGQALIQLVESTVEPDTWDDNKTINFFKPNLSLVVAADNHVHEKVADLLEKLRELNDVVIETKGYLVFGKRSELSNDPVFFGGLQQSRTISNREARMFRSRVLANPSLTKLETPRLSGFNGESLQFGVDQFANQRPLKITTQSVLSHDRESVRSMVKASAETKSTSSFETHSTSETTIIELSELTNNPDEEVLLFVLNTFVIDHHPGF